MSLDSVVTQVPWSDRARSNEAVKLSPRSARRRLTPVRYAATILKDCNTRRDNDAVA
jgi:hypothetical protein